MKLSIIAAISENNVIGNKNKLPWRLAADLKHFKEITLGHPIIMGRKTYESIGRPLPNRENIIITKEPDLSASGCKVVHNIDEAIGAVKAQAEVFFIGGASIFSQILPQVDKLYLTEVHQNFSGDAYFPKINFNEWQEISREDHQPDEKNPYPYSFVVYERKK